LSRLYAIHPPLICPAGASFGNAPNGLASAA